jgi:biopolymer transport protein TolR
MKVKDEPLILTIKKDGRLFLGKQEIPQAELQKKLEAIFEGMDGKELYLRADQAVSYGTVAKAMASAREAGATKLGMVTEHER